MADRDHTPTLDQNSVAASFGLGTPMGIAEPAATGWGDHNLIWKLRTTDGTWAIKQVRRALPAHADAAFAIEMAAHESGVPIPQPVPSSSGRCYEHLDGVPTRCHRWVDGASKNNEDVDAGEARSMGSIVANLHRLRIQQTPRQRRRHHEQSTIGATLPGKAIIRTNG